MEDLKTNLDVYIGAFFSFQNELPTLSIELVRWIGKRRFAHPVKIMESDTVHNLLKTLSSLQDQLIELLRFSVVGKDKCFVFFDEMFVLRADRSGVECASVNANEYKYLCSCVPWVITNEEILGMLNEVSKNIRTLETKCKKSKLDEVAKNIEHLEMKSKLFLSNQ